MIHDLMVYYLVFAISVFSVAVYQKFYNEYRFIGVMPKKRRDSVFFKCFMGCAFLSPVIAMFGLRFGIGTDYSNYKRIYEILNKTDFATYWSGFTNNVEIYYFEPLFYFINRLFPNFILMQLGLGILIFFLLCLSISYYNEQISFSFAILIFLSTQFVYSMNGTRFSIAIMFVLLSYIYLANDDIRGFVILVLLGFMFHKSTLLCLAMVFLKEFKHKRWNNFRNILLLLFIIAFPFICTNLISMIGNIPIFSRYFSKPRYNPDRISASVRWMLHIVPVYLPILVLNWKRLLCSKENKVFLRIAAMEIPFRTLGLLNTNYTRFSRCSQIIQVILIPLLLRQIKNNRVRYAMKVYYVAWYIFYFAYYAIVNDQGDSLPYVWIFQAE